MIKYKQALESLNYHVEIAQWTELFEKMSVQAKESPQDYNYIYLRIEKEEGKETSFIAPFPKGLSPEGLKIVSRYVAARIFNILSTSGARSIKISTDVDGLYDLVTERFESEYNSTQAKMGIKKLNQAYFGIDQFRLERSTDQIDLRQMANMERRNARPLKITLSGKTQEELSVKSILLHGGSWVLEKYFDARNTPNPERRGNAIIVNLGKNLLKLAIVNNDGKELRFIGTPMTVDSFVPKDDLEEVKRLQEKILQSIHQLLESNGLRAKDIIAIGLGVANPVKQGKMLRINTGMPLNLTGERMDQFMLTDTIVSDDLSNKNIFLINDADLEATAISRFAQIRDAVVIRYGTAIAASVIDKDGQIVPGPGELSKIRIDMSDETQPQASTGVRGATRSHIAWMGIAYTAQAHGLYKKYSWPVSIDSNEMPTGERPLDVPRILASWLESGTPVQKEDAKNVFEDSGRWLAVFAHELAQNYSFENIIVGGSLFAGEAGKVMLNTANQALEDQWALQIKPDHLSQDELDLLMKWEVEQGKGLTSEWKRDDDRIKKQVIQIETALGNAQGAKQKAEQVIVDLNNHEFKFKGEEVHILDGTDRKAKVIGRIDRNIAEKDGYAHETAGIVLLAPNGKVILQMRNKENSDDHLSTYGGHLGVGQDHESGVVDEGLQETGLDYFDSPPIFIGYQSFDYPGISNKERRSWFVKKLTEREYKRMKDKEASDEVALLRRIGKKRNEITKAEHKGGLFELQAQNPGSGEVRGTHEFTFDEISGAPEDIDKTSPFSDQTTHFLEVTESYEGVEQKAPAFFSTGSLNPHLSPENRELWAKIRRTSMSLQRDAAMNTSLQVKKTSGPGGIDLTPSRMNLQTQNTGGEIQFNIDPAMLQQLRNAPGFVPVIINIQPMTDLRMFLGLKEQDAVV